MNEELAVYQRAVELAKDQIAELTAARATAESALGTAQAEITRLEQAMVHAARMFTIMGARKIIAQALSDPTLEQSPRKR